jgi:hypothetical protein
VFSGAVPSYELTDFGATRRDANDRAWLAAEKEDRNRDWVALTQVLVPRLGPRCRAHLPCGSTVVRNITSTFLPAHARPSDFSLLYTQNTETSGDLCKLIALHQQVHFSVDYISEN